MSTRTTIFFSYITFHLYFLYPFSYIEPSRRLDDRMRIRSWRRDPVIAAAAIPASYRKTSTCRDLNIIYENKLLRWFWSFLRLIKSLIDIYFLFFWAGSRVKTARLSSFMISSWGRSPSASRPAVCSSLCSSHSSSFAIANIRYSTQGCSLDRSSSNKLSENGGRDVMQTAISSLSYLLLLLSFIPRARTIL